MKKNFKWVMCFGCAVASEASDNLSASGSTTYHNIITGAGGPVAVIQRLSQGSSEQQ